MTIGSKCLWLGGACILACACGSPAGDLRQSESAIVFGEPDTSAEHMAVVHLTIANSWCSGTLISPRVVMTAAHCFMDLDPEQGEIVPEQVEVGFGPDVFSLQHRPVSRLLVHPDYTGGRSLANDIALVRMAADPPAGIDPIPALPAALGLGAGDVGEPVDMVGFGVDENGVAGVKRHVIDEVELVCERSGGCWGDGYRAFANMICFDMQPGGTCSGDSGGPGMVTRTGQEYVAGVTSYGGENCTTYSCSTKVDAFEPFIADFVGAPNGQACIEDDGCASGHCAGGLCCESLCAGRCQSCTLPGSEGRCVVLPDGTDCGDGDVCNGFEVCQAGACIAGSPLACSDGVACTRDDCDAEQGCVFVPQALECFDDNECTRDICDPQTGCRYEVLPDGTDCGFHMTCRAGECSDSGGSGGCGAAAGRPGGQPAWWLLAAALWARARIRRRRGRAQEEA
ncbi:MAG: trypsin-like serine protease [Deltaproteobacteria bacterium]|nr:trypsin-like serine protease [Deltaproteobacteria bacterium]